MKKEKNLLEEKIRHLLGTYNISESLQFTVNIYEINDVFIAHRYDVRVSYD